MGPSRKACGAPDRAGSAIRPGGDADTVAGAVGEDPGDWALESSTMRPPAARAAARRCSACSRATDTSLRPPSTAGPGPEFHREHFVAQSAPGCGPASCWAYRRTVPGWPRAWSRWSRSAMTPAGGERTALSVSNYRRAYKRAVVNGKGLDHLDLRGPHGLRQTYATWIEEAGIPSRVIDELMGHSGDHDMREARWPRSTATPPRGADQSGHGGRGTARRRARCGQGVAQAPGSRASKRRGGCLEAD